MKTYREAREEDHPEDLTIQKVQADEDDYETFKKVLRGTYMPKPVLRQKWSWDFNVGLPEGNRGQALLEAKRIFADVEKGAPKFFNTGRDFIVTARDVEKTADGWTAHFEFTGNFRSERGKQLVFTDQELANFGFHKDGDGQPSIDYFTLSSGVPNEPGMGVNKAVATVAGRLKATFPKWFNTVNAVELVQAEQDPEDPEGDWWVILKFKGDLKVPPEALDDPEIEIVWA